MVGALEIPMRLIDNQLYEKIHALMLNNRLGEGGPAVPIAMQVVRNGLGSLSWKQRFTYLGQVVPLLRSMESQNDAGGATAQPSSGAPQTRCKHSAL
jgi:hypothetical protein